MKFKKFLTATPGNKISQTIQREGKSDMMITLAVKALMLKYWVVRKRKDLMEFSFAMVGNIWGTVRIFSNNFIN